MDAAVPFWQAGPPSNIVAIELAIRKSLPSAEPTTSIASYVAGR